MINGCTFSPFAIAIIYRIEKFSFVSIPYILVYVKIYKQLKRKNGNIYIISGTKKKEYLLSLATRDLDKGDKRQERLTIGGKGLVDEKG